MSGKTSIEWTRSDDGTAGSTWNPVRGCSRKSPGCGGPNHQGGCYAEKIAARFSGPGQPFEGFAERGEHGGRWTGKLALVEEQLLLPLRWKKPRRIFVNSMSDLFHEALPDEAIDKVFAVMALAPQHTYQVLTKRAERMRAYFLNLPERVRRINSAVWSLLGTPIGRRIAHGGNWRASLPLATVWLGVSVEDQERADERIPDLLATPAAVRFLSCEPLLGPIDLTTIKQWAGRPEEFGDALQWYLEGDVHEEEGVAYPHLDWVIAGSESGPRSRPAELAWFRSIRDQCRAAGVSFFQKQLTESGRKLPIEQWPADLRVRLHMIRGTAPTQAGLAAGRNAADDRASDHAAALRSEEEKGYARGLRDAWAPLRDLRAAGWSVAVHNDYWVDGRSYTFWLLTHPSGRWIKGEGETDLEALEQCSASAR
jgi:protein gp37